VSHPRYYIGGANIAGILGVSPFRTPLDEYHTIIGDAPDLDEQTKLFFKRRKALEPFAAAVLEERGFAVIDQNRRIEHEQFPYFKAELDAEVLTRTGDILANSEFKSVHPMASKEWGFDGDPEGAPTYVTAQAQWGLGLSERHYGFIVAVIGFDEHRVYPIEAAADVIGKMQERAHQFWAEHILRKSPPPPSTVDDILRWIEPDPTKVLEASDVDLVHVVDEYLIAREKSAAADKHHDALKARIQMAMADATTLTVHGKPVITWKKAKDGSKTDWESVAASAGAVDPEVIKRHSKTVAGVRRFLTK